MDPNNVEDIHFFLNVAFPRARSISQFLQAAFHAEVLGTEQNFIGGNSHLMYGCTIYLRVHHSIIVLIDTSDLKQSPHPGSTPITLFVNNPELFAQNANELGCAVKWIVLVGERRVARVVGPHGFVWVLGSVNTRPAFLPALLLPMDPNNVADIHFSLNVAFPNARVVAQFLQLAFNAEMLGIEQHFIGGNSNLMYGCTIYLRVRDSIIALVDTCDLRQLSHKGSMTIMLYVNDPHMLAQNASDIGAEIDWVVFVGGRIVARIVGPQGFVFMLASVNTRPAFLAPVLPEPAQAPAQALAQ